MIRLDNVTKTYKGTVPALRDCSVEIGRGEFVFLVGPSGAGKSTFIRLILREETPDRGQIWVAGWNICRLRHWKVPYLRRNIGCVFQDFRLLPNKSVFANVAFALEVIGRPKSMVTAQVPQALDLVGLREKWDCLPSELSGGEQQRVAIARAFVNRPLILLADEPTGNIDPGTSAEVTRLLDRISRTGTTVLIDAAIPRRQKCSHASAGNVIAHDDQTGVKVDALHHATHNDAIVNTMRRRVIELDNGVVVRDEDEGAYDAPVAPYDVPDAVAASVEPTSAGVEGLR